MADGSQPDRTPVSQHERDMLKVMAPVPGGQRTQAEAGLWQSRRHRDEHRRRPRWACFGELVQVDTSIHDRTEGRGEPMVLAVMIDDATDRLLARFYEGETVKAHLDLSDRWLRAHGRPGAVYSDRDGVFQPPPGGPGRRRSSIEPGQSLTCRSWGAPSCATLVILSRPPGVILLDGRSIARLRHPGRPLPPRLRPSSRGMPNGTVLRRHRGAVRGSADPRTLRPAPNPPRLIRQYRGTIYDTAPLFNSGDRVVPTG